ncbi:baseplate multidomain protein megatron [Wenxinia saemankumensis]|uniref:Putative phage tail protein n=1 Tax=Wenxinia saemankumensis TaxID=1447782 RepID=A0A1M6GN53_9RHOB|nr:glycoside hydrolase/phage tail family protein [Wenxinia saemankumensis]SHJ11378.1 Putative phage tail protein [Wenxinia saemankumensis]
MATIVLSAAGMALGGALGGSVLGLSTAVIGRAAGAALGRAIDQRLLGQGAEPVETGRIDRLRLTGASEGAPVGRVWGRMRVPGQVIWAGPLREGSTTTGGGKGMAPRPRMTEYGYTISLAIALCEGEITHLGRVWADGAEIAKDRLNLRLYRGSEDQLPDPAIAAEAGPDAPAYRGTAYVVMEELDLAPFGNRVPQLSFEVFRPATIDDPARAEDMAHLIRGVAMIPGTGEYSLATEPVYLGREFGETRVANVATPSGKADLPTSLDALEGELPNARSVSLVVSWFGDDLRAGRCRLRPKVEQRETDGSMPWSVSGLGRAAAGLVPRVGGSPVYGGTPADAAVVQAIREMRGRGLEVMFYPFILMEHLAGNGLPDPWTGLPGQPALPWRGRITTDRAPGVEGSPDGTLQAEAEVAAFFGAAAPGDFTMTGESVAYDGPPEWSFRRMILHYAHLCAAAGGVDAFCIGSEMVALTQIRGEGGTFPAVEALRRLAGEVRAILGPGTALSYAADWSEYHGYQPPGTGDKLFHLDPLWADPAIDFVGIDNYMPLSDWRDGDDHLDAAVARSVHDLSYLAGNVAGGELYDWFYHSQEARDAQIRTPITDGDGEPWVWRVKDLKGWWSNPHHPRIGGRRQTVPTAWEPRSKPIRFTEFGCAAIDRGTNQPNKFLDPKSSESRLPYFSRGIRDELIQIQYYRAVHRHFAGEAANPVSDVYGGRMVDMKRAHAWAWDARPWPAFPARSDLWSDGGNYARGHWLTGRTAGRPLASVVEEICRGAGLTRIDTSRLRGHVRGYALDEVTTARAALQPLMLAHGFDAVERDGTLSFLTRDGLRPVPVDPQRLAVEDETDGLRRLTRAAEAELAGRVRITHVASEGAYEAAASEARFPGDAAEGVARTDLPLALTRAEGRRIAERWLAESRLARDGLALSLPPSRLGIGPGDVLRIEGEPALWRVDRLEATELQSLEATRIEPGLYVPHETGDEEGAPAPFAPPVPVTALFLDLPLLTGGETPHAPHLALSSRPWPGPVALLSAPEDAGYVPLARSVRPATIGVTETTLRAAAPGLWDRGPALRVRLLRGAFSSASEAQVLAGRNALAIGTGGPEPWEVLQFAEAEAVGPDLWDLRMRLRGQAGTDGTMPQEWPAGSRVVLLDGRVRQVQLAPGTRGLARHYRWGPEARPPGDPTWRHAELAFRGVGSRPYAVCHLSAKETGGDLALRWIRRTRIGGDDWTAAEVPLGEEVERYRVGIVAGGIFLREVEVSSPTWTYPAAERAADGTGPGATGWRVEVAQLSTTWGAGPARILAFG